MNTAGSLNTFEPGPKPMSLGVDTITKSGVKTVNSMLFTSYGKYENGSIDIFLITVELTDVRGVGTPFTDSEIKMAMMEMPNDCGSRQLSLKHKMDYPVILVFERIYYPILAAVGITVNLVAIFILRRGKCGLSKCIIRYLVAMAVADLMVVIFEEILKRINNIYLPINFLFITPICAMTLVAKVAALDCSVWFTVAFTFDRFVAISCPNMRARYCTPRTTSVVIALVVALACLRSAPFYFVFESKYLIDHIPYLCILTAAYLTSPWWAAMEWFSSILNPLVPIVLILLLNALTVKHIIKSNKVRRALMSNVDNPNDPERENRKKSMILLFALSGNFIVLWTPYFIHSLKWQTTNYSYTDKYYSNPIFIYQETGFMLQLLSSSTNTCIYGLTQRKFRQELKNGVKYLVTLNARLSKVSLEIYTLSEHSSVKDLTERKVAITENSGNTQASQTASGKENQMDLFATLFMSFLPP
ncbi:probable G-protein coupled receptor 139 [Narcine bancroftii]|uniref:probable G-protein coupled receptor 139 n=1 Tax=Narcine bancroftii TaxID=1343680 RepID=UPI003831A97D